jgi:hypothetical protein
MQKAAHHSYRIKNLVMNDRRFCSAGNNSKVRHYSNNNVGTPFGISNHEEIDVSVAQGRWQVVVPDILRNITLEIIKCFAAFFGKPLPLPSLEIFQRGSDRVRRHQDVRSGASEGTAEQDKRHLDELAPLGR